MKAQVDLGVCEIYLYQRAKKCSQSNGFMPKRYRNQLEGTHIGQIKVF